MELGRIEIILIMGLMAFALRALPQILLPGENFPQAWERYLRYISYALISTIIALTLFMSAGRFEAESAPFRGAALALTALLARKTKSAVTGMLAGSALMLLYSWFR